MNFTRPVPPRTRERFALSGRGERDRRPRTSAEIVSPGRQNVHAARPCEAALARLSPREREVFHLLVMRYSDREIADVLFISYRTVTTHVTSILNKLGVDSRREAAAAFSPYDEH